MTVTYTWKSMPMNRHFWAFYYYCKRQGDKVSVIKKLNDGTAILSIQKEERETRYERFYNIT